MFTRATDLAMKTIRCFLKCCRFFAFSSSVWGSRTHPRRIVCYPKNEVQELPGSLPSESGTVCHKRDKYTWSVITLGVLLVRASDPWFLLLTPWQPLASVGFLLQTTPWMSLAWPRWHFSELRVPDPCPPWTHIGTVRGETRHSAVVEIVVGSYLNLASACIASS